MTGLQIYLISILDSIYQTSIGISIILGIMSIISIFCFIIVKYNYNEYEENYLKVWKLSAKITTPIFIFFLLIAVFTPNSKHGAAIFVIPKGTNYAADSKELKEMPENILRAANEWLKAQIDTTKTE